MSRILGTHRLRLSLSLLLVGATAVAVRLPGVYGRPFWEDEVASARILAQPSLLAMLHRVAQTESTPPLWYLVAWVPHQVGLPLQSERLLSVAFGALFAMAVVRLALRFARLSLATAAGLMTAFGTEFVVHGSELRAYELLALLSVVFGLCVLRLLEQPARRWDVALAATVAAGCLTHYFFGLSVGAMLAWLWLDRGARHIRRRATVAVLAGTAVAASAAPVLLAQYGHGRFRWIGPFRWRTVVAVPLRLFTYAESNVPVGPLLSVSTLALLVVGGFMLGRRSTEGRLVAVLAFGPIAAAAAAWGTGLPIFDLRNLIGVGAYVAVLAAGALNALSRRAGAFGAAAVVAAIGLTLIASNATRIPAYDAMARSLVRSGWTVSKPILVYGDPYRYRLPFEWYLPRQPVLDMSRSLEGACADVLVVSPAGKITHRRLIADTTLHGETLLVDPGHRPRCVELDPAGTPQTRRA